MSAPARRLELLAPGGSFAAAIQAFEAGADGVYFGLAKFSARRGAVNLSRPELRRLRSAAATMGNKFLYAAVNTVVRDEELPELLDALVFLEAVEVAGVIIQDLGVFEILRREFPRLPVHASTQMAAHDSRGVGVLKDLGFSRVILARELSFRQIEAIRREHPDIELEVFVHGALCYAFSGICLASGMLLGRSANRGECAQLCRNYYSLDGGTAGHWFSCRDLALEEDALRLRDLGVDALKIEGRMKPPEYVRAHTALYRALLDGVDPRCAEAADLKAACALTFSRRRCQGYRDGAGAAAVLLCNGYPGHRGLPLGRVLRVQGRAFELAPERALSRKDGLLFFRDGDESKPVAFAADKLTALNGDEIGVAHPGRPVWVHTNAEALPDPGQELRHISSRLQDLKSVSPEIWPLFAGRLAAVCRCGADGLCEIAADCHGFRVGAEMRLSISRARNRRDFNEVLSKMFAESDKSLWRATEIRLENATGLAADEIFVPPSELKKLKNSFYAALDAMAAELPARLLARLDAMPWPEPLPGTVCGSLPPRRQLGPEAGASHPIPFIVSPDEVRRLTAAAGKTPDGPLFLPLGPLSFASGELFQAVEDAVRGAAGRRVLVGINNVSHLELARRLRDLPRVSFFADFLFYVANRQTLRFLAGTVPGLAFAYSWIEGGQEVAETLRRKLPAGQAVLIRQIEPEFKPPLFISLACFWKHNGLGKPCRECGGEPPPARLKNGGQHFLARSAGCVTYFFAEDRQALAESASPTAVKYSNID